MLDVPASHKRAWGKARVVGSDGAKKKKKIGHLGCNLDGQNENKGVAVKDKGMMGSSAKRANASYHTRVRMSCNSRHQCSHVQCRVKRSLVFRRRVQRCR
jgi:hypothetical protein